MKYLLSIILLINSMMTFGQHPDHAELKKLYLSTNGDNWKNNKGWKEGINNPNSNPCNGWHGIICSSGILNRIELDSNNLTGSFPLEIDLPKLVWFRADSNKISGPIPYFTGPLTQLNLSKNKLTGSIPEYMEKFKNISNLSFVFTTNDLSGCYPPFMEFITSATFGTINNPKLPYKGDHSKVFVQNLPQIGATCDDGKNNGMDFINDDCTCHDAAPCEDVSAERVYSVCFGSKFKFYNVDYSVGVYDNIRITNSNNCDTIFKLTINSYPQIIVNLGPDKQICANAPTQIGIAPLSESQGITYTYQWSDGAPGAMRTIITNIPKDYTLTVRNNFNCSASDSIKINVLDKIDFTINASVCPGEFFNFKGIPYSAGNHEFFYDNPNGCDTLYNINVGLKPVITVSDPLFIDCKTDQILILNDRLQNEPSDGTWKEVSVIPSSGGFNASSGTFNPFNQKPGLYTFSYEMKPGTYCGLPNRLVNINVTECDSTTSCAIKMYPDSIKVVRGDYSINILDNDEIEATDIALEITDYNSTLLSDISLSSTGDLKFTLIDTLLDSTAISYILKSLTCNYENLARLKLLSTGSDIVVTNVITPNGDGFNDVLRFNDLDKINGSELWIYNRWGNKIYYSKDYKNDWTGDGYHGGAYYYVLKVNNEIFKSALTIIK